MRPRLSSFGKWIVAIISVTAVSIGAVLVTPGVRALFPPQRSWSHDPGPETTSPTPPPQATPPAATPPAATPPAATPPASSPPASPPPANTPPKTTPPKTPPPQTPPPETPPSPPPRQPGTYLAGTYRVPGEIKPGIYRAEGGIDYWARLSGLSGDFSDTIQNDLPPDGLCYVEVKPTDAAFRFSGDGELAILPGSYQGIGLGAFGRGIYWARLSGLSGDLHDIIASDLPPGGRCYVEISATDLAFRMSGNGKLSPVGGAYSGPCLTEFGPGQYLVGEDILPGLYRSASGLKYWARYEGFGHELSDIIANHGDTGGPVVVEIEASDFGFQSNGPGTLVRIGADYRGERLTKFGEGFWIVGKDIEPGLYRSATGARYWARLSGFSGESSDLLANGAGAEGPAMVEIKPADAGFYSVGATWEKVK